MRNDSFFDAFVRRGITQYMGNNSYYERKAYDDELTELFHNALARRIVTALVDDCVSRCRYLRRRLKISSFFHAVFCFFEYAKNLE